MDDSVEGSDERVTALEQQLAVVLQRLEVLEHENEALRSTSSPANRAASAVPAAEPGPEPATDGGVTRRRLLVGSVGAAAVGEEAMVTSATPATAKGKG